MTFLIIIIFNQKVASKVLDYQKIYNKKVEKPNERRGTKQTPP